MVEGTGLENRQTCKRFEGSNPSLSAISPISLQFNCEYFARSKRSTIDLVVVPEVFERRSYTAMISDQISPNSRSGEDPEGPSPETAEITVCKLGNDDVAL